MNTISIERLRKVLVELQFNGVINEEQIKALFKMIEDFKEAPRFKSNRIARHEYVGTRCWHCRWLNGERTSVGIECTNPNIEWRHRTSKYKQPSVYACKKYFERRDDADI